MIEHDEQCESEYIAEAGGYTLCGCEGRRVRRLIQADAWDEGWRAGVEAASLGTDIRNPYREG